jgi:hypothetical protein
MNPNRYSSQQNASQSKEPINKMASKRQTTQKQGLQLCNALKEIKQLILNGFFIHFVTLSSQGLKEILTGTNTFATPRHNSVPLITSTTLVM